MAAVTDAPAIESVNLAEAVALISEAAEDDAAPEVSQAEHPAGPAAAAEEATAAPEGEVARVPAATAGQPTPDAAEAASGAAGSDEVAPDFWDDDDKKAWTTVPAELRPVLRKYEQQRLDFVAERTRQATEERDEAMRVAQAANATVEQAADWWRKNGQTFHQAFVDRWSRVDWKGLAEKDPAEIGRLMQQRQEEEALLAEATRRGEADVAAAEAQAEKELEEARRVESGKLAAKLPEWFGTPQVAQRTWDDLRRYLFAKGVPADRITAVYESPIVEIALNAMRFENAQALAQRVRQKSRANPEAVTRSGRSPAAAAAPARVSPGPASLPVDRAPDAVRQVRERFHRSGGASIADAAELIRLTIYNGPHPALPAPHPFKDRSMAAPVNTFITNSAVGNRESLHNIITLLNKDETPFISTIGSGDADATYEEWQLDALGNADTNNSNLEGDDTTAAAITPTLRVGNRTQILKKPFTISTTQEAVKKAGRESEISYQTALAGRRAKMDLEAIACQNQASAAQAGAVTRKLGGFESWLTSNVSRGAGGASGGFAAGNTVAPTDGTQRASTEALLKGVIRSAWTAGGKPTLLLMGGTQKQAFSAFTGIATQYQEPKGKAATVIGAVDRYVSDFGTFNAMASRFVRGREIEVIDPSLWRLLWLRKWKKEELAKTGDARKFHIIGEVTLESRNEAGNGIVADLT